MELNHSVRHALDTVNETSRNGSGFVSDATVYLFVSIILVFMWIICLWGMATNSVNIIVFSRLGFQDSINISLFALAVSDLMGCVFILIENIGFYPDLLQLTLPFSIADLTYTFVSWPKIICMKMTKALTAFLALERCLCVAIPLKVKSVITSKFVKTTVILMSIIVFTAHIPMFYIMRLKQRPTYYSNATILGLAFIPGNEKIQQAFYLSNAVLVSGLLDPVIIICTITLFVTLKRQAKWRQKTSSAMTENPSNVSSKDTRVARMVAVVTFIFLVCDIPALVLSITVALVPELSLYGKYSNLLFVLGNITKLTGVINSSFNFFVYYTFSSNYNEMFHKLIAKRKQ